MKLTLLTIKETNTPSLRLRNAACKHVSVITEEQSIHNMKIKIIAYLIFFIKKQNYCNFVMQYLRFPWQ
jgi:hypothetical protein